MQWVLIEDDGFTLGRMTGIDRIAFAEITGVRLRQRRLPRWVSGLLWLSGNLQAKATALLHAGRASSWLELDCHGRPALIVPADGFPGLEALIEVVQRFGIPLDPSILPRRPRRAAKGEQHDERPMDIPS